MYIEIEFKKPLYQYEGAYCIRLYDKYLKQAKKTGKALRITTPHGVGIYTYQEWMKGAKKFKQVYLIPERPMILWEQLFTVGHGVSVEHEFDEKLYWKNMSRLSKICKKILSRG